MTVEAWAEHGVGRCGWLNLQPAFAQEWARSCCDVCASAPLCAGCVLRRTDLKLDGEEYEQAQGALRVRLRGVVSWLECTVQNAMLCRGREDVNNNY